MGLPMHMIGRDILGLLTVSGTQSSGLKWWSEANSEKRSPFAVCLLVALISRRRTTVLENLHRSADLYAQSLSVAQLQKSDWPPRGNQPGPISGRVPANLAQQSQSGD